MSFALKKSSRLFFAEILFYIQKSCWFKMDSVPHEALPAEVAPEQFNGTDIDQQVKETFEKTEDVAIAMSIDEISKKSIKSKTR